MAELGPSVYDPSFRPTRDQEDVGARSMIQSIATTTTSPPDEVKTEPWSDPAPRGVAEVRLTQLDQ